MNNNFENDNNKFIRNNIVWFNFGITGKKYYHMFFCILLYSFPYILMLVLLIIMRKYMTIIYPIIVTSIFYFLQIILTLLGGCTDPGIFPNQLNDDYYKTNKPLIKYVIKGNILLLKYCYTCSVFRPPKTSHCSVYDNCVERIDHHCSWLGTCIGKRNYKFFYLLLFSLTFSGIFQIFYSLYYIVFQFKKL